MNTDPGQVTALLKAMKLGDSKAADSLLPLVYGELHRLAKSYMRRERPEHTLQNFQLVPNIADSATDSLRLILPLFS